MTDNARRAVKNTIREVLEKLRPGESINRHVLWNIVHGRVLDREILFLEDIRATFENAEIDDRSLRAIVTELKHEGLAVGSSNRGYFMINNEGDYAEAIKSYEKKIYGMFAEIKQTRKNAEERIGRKLSHDAFYGEGSLGA